MASRSTAASTPWMALRSRGWPLPTRTSVGACRPRYPRYHVTDRWGSRQREPVFPGPIRSLRKVASIRGCPENGGRAGDHDHDSGRDRAGSQQPRRIRVVHGCPPNAIWPLPGGNRGRLRIRGLPEHGSGSSLSVGHPARSSCPPAHPDGSLSGEMWRQQDARVSVS